MTGINAPLDQDGLALKEPQVTDYSGTIDTQQELAESGPAHLLRGNHSERRGWE